MTADEYASALHLERYTSGASAGEIGDIADKMVQTLRAAEARAAELKASRPNLSNRELVAECNALARKFYAMQGYEVGTSVKFYNSTHPHESGCWNMAVAAYEHTDGTEVEDALNEMRDDEREEGSTNGT